MGAGRRLEVNGNMFAGTLLFQNAVEGAGTAGNAAAGAAADATQFLVGNWGLLAIGILLIIAAVIVLFLLKKIIINTVLGLVCWGIVYFLFSINLPLLPSFVLAVIFGPAGVGAMLVLRFMGIV